MDLTDYCADFLQRSICILPIRKLLVIGRSVPEEPATALKKRALAHA